MGDDEHRNGMPSKGSSARIVAEITRDRGREIRREIVRTVVLVIRCLKYAAQWVPGAPALQRLAYPGFPDWEIFAALVCWAIVHVLATWY